MGRMCETNPLSEAISIVGLSSLARGVGLTHQALRKWERAGRMPRTEWTGETAYAEKIEELTGGQVTKARLLARWPVVAPCARSAPAQPAIERAAALQLIERRATDRRQDGGPPPDGYYKRTGGQRRREWR